MGDDRPVLEYRSEPRASRWAMVAFVLAVVGAVGFFLVVPAVLAMLVAAGVRDRISPKEDERGHRLATMAVRISGWSSVAGVLMFVLLEFPGHGSRELPNRSRCAANVRGIMQAMVVYAQDNGDELPAVMYAPYGTAANEAKGVSSGTNDEKVVLERYYAGAKRQAGSVQASMWMLVLNGMVGPKQFICKSDPFASAPAAWSDAGGVYDNFQKGKQLSYSMAYPWKADGTVGAWWKNTMDAGLPLVADMTPRQGTGKPKRDVTPAGVPADSKTWNSGNHMGDGQNVGFADAHAEFVRRPDVGHDGDNIYSMSGVPSRGPARFGGVAAGAAAPQLMAEKMPFDVVMVPVRDESSGGM